MWNQLLIPRAHCGIELLIKDNNVEPIIDTNTNSNVLLRACTDIATVEHASATARAVTELVNGNVSSSKE